ncbi:MAG: molecular chaperone DnaJ [Chloroflexus sp.]|uniref:J domain-containing protein n=1 Tax=Chloroflexus sp. TaxID=1904827 RepID=UPI0021DCB2F8|nr:J domain-containing protein [Chloroflexus sp.]GIV89421.1 MAG: molecular chaperone DnaJ [Chloroflexus sp.]
MNDDFDQLDDYAILGIRPGASPNEIKQAYLQQISRYHPDRFVGASPAEQEYAARRARRINQAYQNLRKRRPSAVPSVSVQRDYQAELYDQAQKHLAAGRRLQALATLRELQQINPWYRDCATLIAELEAEYQPVVSAGRRTVSRRTILTVAVGSLTFAFLGWYGWRQFQGTQTASGSVGATMPTPTTAAPAPTTVPSPTSTLSPTATRTPVPTTTPTTTPTVAVSLSPSPFPNPTITGGPIVYQADFGLNSDWPTANGNGWSVGARDGSYIIQTNVGRGDIWAFRTAPIGPDMIIEVTVDVRGDWAGLMLRFNDPQHYIRFLVNPANDTFRCDERNGDQRTLFAEGSVSLGERTRLVARLEGETVELWINDQQVGKINSATPAADTRYGFVALAERTPTTAIFRDLVIRALR